MELWWALRPPDTEVTDECIWTLPSTDGTAGQVLATDGAKQLSWASGIDTSGASAGQVLVFNGDSIDLILKSLPPEVFTL